MAREEAEDASKPPAVPITEVFDNFNLDKSDEDSVFKRILQNARERRDQDDILNLPPVSLLTELKGKLKQRQITVIEKEPVAFRVFDETKERFIETSKSDRAQKEAHHKEELAKVKREELAQKR